METDPVGPAELNRRLREICGGTDAEEYIKAELAPYGWPADEFVRVELHGKLTLLATAVKDSRLEKAMGAIALLGDFAGLAWWLLSRLDPGRSETLELLIVVSSYPIKWVAKDALYQLMERGLGELAQRYYESRGVTSALDLQSPGEPGSPDR